jgi:hypothetical protein
VGNTSGIAYLTNRQGFVLLDTVDNTSKNKKGNKIKQSMRSWHIWDFPDNIYLLIKDNARKNFFKFLYERFDSRRRSAAFLNLDPSTIKEWEEGFSKKGRDMYVQYIPVWVFKRCRPFLTEEIVESIENSVVAYRCRAGEPVKNPILPIKESSALYRLASHIMGDGSATKGKMPYYSNTCKELREEFKRDLKYFGKSSVIEYTNKNDVTLIMFPKAIADVLQNILEISFIKKDKLSHFVFLAPVDCKTATIRAFFDDEGTMSSALAVAQSSVSLLQDLKNLLAQLGLESGKLSIMPQKNRKPHCSFSIRSSSLVKFSNLIGFSHPDKKAKLDLALRARTRVERYRKIDTIDNLIHNSLRPYTKTTLEVANEVQFTLNGARAHLRRLENQEKVSCKKERGRLVWRLKDVSM